MARMKHPKTTTTGILTGALAILAHYGIGVPSELFAPILAVGTGLLGIFSGDGKKNDR